MCKILRLASSQPVISKATSTSSVASGQCLAVKAPLCSTLEVAAFQLRLDSLLYSSEGFLL